MSRRPFPLGGDNAAIQTKVVVFCIVKNTKAPVKSTKSLAISVSVPVFEVRACWRHGG